MVFEIGDASRAEEVLRRKIERGERLMGFGHRVYKVRDPRADVLAAAAERMFTRAGDMSLYTLARAVEATALRLLEEYKPGPPAADERRVLHGAAAARPRARRPALHADVRHQPRQRLDRARAGAAPRQPHHPPAVGIRRPARSQMGADAGSSRESGLVSERGLPRLRADPRAAVFKQGGREDGSKPPKVSVLPVLPDYPRSLITDPVAIQKDGGPAKQPAHHPESRVPSPESLTPCPRSAALLLPHVPRGRPTVRVKGSTRPLSFLRQPSVPRPHCGQRAAERVRSLSKEGRCHVRSTRPPGSRPQPRLAPQAGQAPARRAAPVDAGRQTRRRAVRAREGITASRAGARSRRTSIRSRSTGSCSTRRETGDVGALRALLDAAPGQAARRATSRTSGRCCTPRRTRDTSPAVDLLLRAASTSTRARRATTRTRCTGRRPPGTSTSCGASPTREATSSVSGDDHALEVIGWATCWDGCDDDAHRAVADLLVSRGARHHIFSAIAMNLADEVRRIVAADPSALNRRMSRNENHQLPLHFAVRMNRPEMVALLLELGADPLGADGSGYPAAAYASSPRHRSGA